MCILFDCVTMHFFFVFFVGRYHHLQCTKAASGKRLGYRCTRMCFNGKPKINTFLKVKIHLTALFMFFFLLFFHDVSNIINIYSEENNLLASGEDAVLRVMPSSNLEGFDVEVRVVMS